jgi:uncharacterized protein
VIQREYQVRRVRELLDRYPVVALIGARQVGKTTLARQIAAAEASATRFDLENPLDLARLADPLLALEPLHGLVVLDEIQRKEEIFPVLRVLADRPDNPARFLVLGSASPELLKQSSESLAGRIFHYALDGFDLREVGLEALDALWLRGGFPRSFLASSDMASLEWRSAFTRTFLERDIPQLGITVPSETLYRFWTMLAHYHGQLWNGAELARAFGVSATTVRRYLDLLTSTLVLRQIQPWFENVSKRQVRAPKVYVADAGILHALLGVETLHQLHGHPKVGASWEGFVISQLVSRFELQRNEVYFWATHAGAEIDLMVMRRGRRTGFEIKRTTTPAVTRSMSIASADLRLDRIYVVHAGAGSFQLAEGVEAIDLASLGRVELE